MRIVHLFILLAACGGFSVGCSSRTGPGAKNTSKERAVPVVLTNPRDRQAHVGKTVTVVGKQTRTKIPTVCDVDVDGAYDLSDKLVEATGVLERRVVPKRTGGPIVASRGPGTYYRLVDPKTKRLAKTQLRKSQ